MPDQQQFQLEFWVTNSLTLVLNPMWVYMEKPLPHPHHDGCLSHWCAPQHHYTWAYLPSMPKDDEVLVFQAPITPFGKISHPTWYSTNHAIALPVEKILFPSPLINAAMIQTNWQQQQCIHQYPHLLQ